MKPIRPVEWNALKENSVSDAFSEIPVAAPDGRLLAVPPGAAERRLRRPCPPMWQAVTLATLFVGYAGYYVCRSDLSVAGPSLIDEFGDRGIGKKELGDIASLGVLLYALLGKKTVNGVLADRVGGRTVLCSAWCCRSWRRSCFAVGGTLAGFAELARCCWFSLCPGRRIGLCSRWAGGRWFGSVRGWFPATPAGHRDGGAVDEVTCSATLPRIASI